MALAVVTQNEKPVPAQSPRLALIALLFLGTTAAATPPAGTPRRIVSLNLCADQLLVALADPGQIAALTTFARDRTMSAEAERAARIPVSHGAAEDVLALSPDLILASPFRRKGTLAVLMGHHYRIIDLPPAESYPEIVTQIRTVAAAVGHPERGEAMIKRMDADLATIPRLRHSAVAAYYQRRGYLTGTGTLVDDLMKRVGLRNLAGEMGKSPLSRLSVEQMVVASPDYLIMESATDRVTDQGTEMLHHPALSDIPRLRLPQAWTVCGGPSYVKAARSLSDQLAVSARKH